MKHYFILTFVLASSLTFAQTNEQKVLDKVKQLKQEFCHVAVE